jgi:hypothetical protein
MKLIAAQTIPEVWLAAAEHVKSCSGRDFDVFLNVATPTKYEGADRKVFDALDGFLRHAGGLRIKTVAETIFPMSYYKRDGAAGVYESYPAAMRAIRGVRTADRSWGTYALRLMQPRIDGKKRQYIPLKDAVEKIKSKGNYTAAHELGLGPIEEDIEIYQPDTDRQRPYGGPCLSHLSFKIDGGFVRLNATYRSHFYVQRLFGNMLGLAYLQVFVAKECGLAVGPLTINSTYAQLDTLAAKADSARKGWTVRDITKLLADCRKIYDEDAATPLRAIPAHTPQPSDA